MMWNETYYCMIVYDENPKRYQNNFTINIFSGYMEKVL